VLCGAGKPADKQDHAAMGSDGLVCAIGCAARRAISRSKLTAIAANCLVSGASAYSRKNNAPRSRNPPTAGRTEAARESGPHRMREPPEVACGKSGRTVWQLSQLKPSMFSTSRALRYQRVRWS